MRGALQPALSKSNAEALPLYEGRMVQMYDHRASNVVMNVGNIHRAAQQEAVGLPQHQDPKFFPTPQFYVYRSDIDKVEKSDWAISFKLITAPTNMRTMISAILPKCAIGNSMGMLLPDAEARDDNRATLRLTAALSRPPNIVGDGQVGAA